MRFRRALRYGALAALGLAAQVTLAAEPPQDFVLQLVINGRAAGEAVDVANYVLPGTTVQKKLQPLWKNAGPPAGEGG